MSAILCCRTSPRPPRLRFSPRWARGNPLVLPCSQIWVWCNLARFPVVSGELLVPAMEDRRACPCSRRRPPSPFLPDRSRPSDVKPTATNRTYPFGVNLSKEPLHCIFLKATRSPKRIDVNTFSDFWRRKVFRLDFKIRFHELRVCHWNCFAHKIFILNPIWSIQIALDS